MHETNLRSIDLNLLTALKALLDEKHVTRAAHKINLSQPAMSRALARLRQLLKDPLLVKGKNGLDLSSRAQLLYNPLQNILKEIHCIISPPTNDPLLMKDEITIATRDYEMVAVLPKIIQYISKHAPGLTLRIVHLTGDNLSLLEENKVDFILSGTDNQSATLYRHQLFQEDFVCLVSAKNSFLKKDFTLKKFLQMKHCLVTINGFGPGIVDTILSEKGLKREIIIRVPHFLAAAYIVADSDLIVTLPRHAGLLVSQHNKLRLLEPPLKIPSFSIYLYWHARNQNNPVHQWLRKSTKNIEFIK